MLTLRAWRLVGLPEERTTGIDMAQHPTDAVLVRVARTSPAAFPDQLTKAESLGIAYIAARLRQAGLGVEILDGHISDLSLEVLLQRVLSQRAPFVGISIMDSSEVENCLTLAMSIKKTRGPETYVTAGGHIATLLARKILGSGSVDSVVLHEGEETTAELCEKVIEGRDWKSVKGIAYLRNGRFCATPPRPRPDLNILPFPARDTLDDLMGTHGKFIVSLVSSRGCHKRCVFCTNHEFFGTWRPRTPESVVDEIEQLVTQHNVKQIDFQDATFIGPGKRGQERAREIADGIIRRRLPIKFRISCTPDSIEFGLFKHLKKAGLYGVNTGIESGYQPALVYFNKFITVADNARAFAVLSRLGLLHNSTIGFIMFRPSATFDEIKANLAFLKAHLSYISPVCLTNSLEFPPMTAQKDGGPLLGCTTGAFAESSSKVSLLRAGFNIISAYFLEDYYRITAMSDGVRKKALKRWTGVVLRLAGDFLGECENADMACDDARVLLRSLNALCCEKAKMFRMWLSA